MTILQNLLKRKNPDDAVESASKGGLEKTLGVWDLIILGVGAIIGSGIFAVVGIAAAGSADGASPGVLIHILLQHSENLLLGL